MLRGIGVGERNLLVFLVEQYDPAVGQRIADRLAAAEIPDLLLDGPGYLPCETLRPADQDGLAVVPVLGLRQQIGGDEFRRALLSASTITSEGPAGRSTATASVLTSCLARVTYRFPGPKIFSTCGMLSVP